MQSLKMNSYWKNTQKTKLKITVIDDIQIGTAFLIYAIKFTAVKFLTYYFANNNKVAAN